ncbi:MAG: helix-turn-helix domain-containing protein [Streptomycetales bacterium]
MAADLSPTVRLRRLGAELRRLRDTSGLTLDEAGDKLERSPSSLSKIENGRVNIRPRDLRVILDGYGLTDEGAQEWLLNLARHGRRKGWWQSYEGVLSPAYTDLIALEADAASVRTFETLLLPGLLQTEEYAREVIRGPRIGSDPQEIDTFVEVRTARQRVLARDEPLALWAIVGEAALRQQVGGPQVLRRQLARLRETAELPNVTLQVLPYDSGAHPGVDGPFAILGFPEYADMDVVLLENMTSSLYLEQEAEVIRYTVVFDHLRAAALPPAESLVLIAQVERDL